MPHFNLVRDPWIPVRWKNNRTNRPLVSLHDAFAEGAEIADLSCAPHERVSLIRLLVCITQAAIGAPPTPDDWNGWGNDLATSAPAYLGKWSDRFNLFGDGPRFLQVKVPAKEEAVPSSKLIPHFATGNNPLPFDHYGGTHREIPSAVLALALLSFQAFYPLYGAGHKGKGPCVDSNMIHLVLVGRNLHETIVLNCLDAESIIAHFGNSGKPLWELEPVGKDAKSNATATYLGRLVPRHRNLMLLDNGSGFFLSKDCHEYPAFPAFVEPSATTVIRKKGGTEQILLLQARLDRALWRDLHTVLMLNQATRDSRHAPLILQSHLPQLDGAGVSLWLGALVTDLKAKIIDSLTSTFTVPIELMKAEGQQRYEDGVRYAEEMSKRIYGAVKIYSSTMMHEAAPTDSAQRHYWNALDHQSRMLLSLLEGMFTEHDPMRHWPFGARHDGGAFDPWTAAVRRALQDAYDHACPRQTPRQIQAYAAGLRVLLKQEKTPSKKKTPESISMP